MKVIHGGKAKNDRIDTEVIDQLDRTFTTLETHVLKHAKVHDPVRLCMLQTIPGVGKVLIERWRKAYNTVRPHSSLGYRPPAPESRRPCPLGSAAPHQADRGEPSAGQP